MANMSQSPTSTQSHAMQGAQTYSCLLCRQRKVRCNRRSPCSNCLKADQPCRFVPPTRGRRERRKPPKETLHAKLARYESLLQTYGVAYQPTTPATQASLSDAASPSSCDAETDSPGQTFRREHTLEKQAGRLFQHDGFSRYYDNPLWSNFGNGLQHPEASRQTNHALDETINDGGTFFELEGGEAVKDLSALHFSSAVLSRLMELYLDRVDAFVKILHVPSFRKAMVPALQQPRAMSRSLEALAFSFYLSVINALSNDECVNMLNLGKLDAFRRYRAAARQALVNAQFLSTWNLTTLQAYSLLIICVRGVYPIDALHILSGIAIRMARKMGLHRDGTTFGLPPIDTEIRRRLWWHLAYIDFRVAETLGIRPSLDLCDADTRIPTNVRDENLDSTTSEPPAEDTGITPVTLGLIRFEMMNMLQKLSPTTNAPGWETLSNPEIALAEKENAINHLQDQLEGNYLRHCDPSNGFDTFVSIMVRSSICKMKLFAHRSLVKSPGRASDKERGIILNYAIKLLEYVPLIHGALPGLDKYKWQLGTSHVWNTVLYALVEVRRRGTGPEVARAWHAIGQIFKYYPQVSEKASGATVYEAISKWTMEAWGEYAATMRTDGMEPSTPEYIQALQSQQTRSARTRADNDASPEGGKQQHSAHPQDTSPDTFPDTSSTTIGGINLPTLLSLETDPAEWLQWEQLLANHEVFS